MAEGKKDNIFTPKRTVKYFIVNLVTMTVVAMIVWPLLDMLLENIFDGGYKGWDVQRGIIEPCIFAVIITIVEFVFWNIFHKKKN